MFEGSRSFHQLGAFSSYRADDGLNEYVLGAKRFSGPFCQLCMRRFCPTYFYASILLENEVHLKDEKSVHDRAWAKCDHG